MYGKLAILLIILLVAGCSQTSNETKMENKRVSANYPIQKNGDYEIPQSAIHWHPKLKIIIKGQEQEIPINVGISIGQNIDNEISGMRMSPIHTHEDDGTIHMENDKPYAKPETLTLGYFFKVWNKTFNSTCIFKYCNGPEGKVKMLVNGEENDRFDSYYMRDGDQIEIRYE